MSTMQLRVLLLLPLLLLLVGQARAPGPRGATGPAGPAGDAGVVAWPQVAPDGTAGSPSYSLALGDGGVYYVAAGRIGMSVANTRQIEIGTSSTIYGYNDNFTLSLGSANTTTLASGGSSIAIPVNGAVKVTSPNGVQLITQASVGTCSSAALGSIVPLKGGVSEGYTKLCFCVSDGAGTPAYAWCSAQFTAAATTFVCTGGSSTVCP